MKQYEEFIHKSKYARWIEDWGRRENWEETVFRYIDFFFEDAECDDAKELYEAIVAKDVMPSMRAMMTAGGALERDNVAGYNCAYVAIENQRVFDEILYVLMCGTGVGYSIESKYVSQLQEISDSFHETDTVILVADSKIGWAKAYRELISLLYSGQVPQWDISKVRAAGERLKTFGGRSSGPDPLENLFKFTVNTFRRFAGQRLPTVAVHDLVCKVAEIVVVGGVRRSALISLSDRDDKYMRLAKNPYHVKEYTLLDRLDNGDRKYSVIVDDEPYGERSLILELNDWDSEQLQADHTIGWFHVHPERQLANNSISYDQDVVSTADFLTEWKSLYDSYSGERGIFNRRASVRSASRNGRRNVDYDFGTNPCSEIILRSKQFCNLSEVVIREGDTFDDLSRKVRLATILGTIQSGLTDFRYLSAQWRRNTEEERLLGVSLTGIMDHPIMSGKEHTSELSVEDSIKYPTVECQLKDWLTKLKEIAIETNDKWAKALGIPNSSAITCVKPSGTVSQLVNSSSGIHCRYSDYYIRRVRNDLKDPLARLLIEQGVPHEFAKGDEDSTVIFEFPIKSPDGALITKDQTAIDQLELWKIYQDNWCEHKPSITVFYKEEEFMDVGAWVYNNFDDISGISFLPLDDHVYPQPPYEEITKDEYNKRSKEFPTIDWDSLDQFESEDNTVAMQTLACVSGQCEV